MTHCNIERKRFAATQQSGYCDVVRPTAHPTEKAVGRETEDKRARALNGPFEIALRRTNLSRGAIIEDKIVQPEITMDRQLLAYFLIVLLAAAVAAGVVLTRRFVGYQRALRFGRHHVKPVWKPFWIP